MADPQLAPLRICMLLNGDVRNDSRVLNVIRSLGRVGQVDLYYPAPAELDPARVPAGVRLFRCPPPAGLRSTIVRHSLLHLEHVDLGLRAGRSGIRYDVVHANDYPTLLPALRLAERLDAKLVYDSHEIYMETVNQQFPLGAGGLRGLMFRVMVGLIRRVGWHMEARFAQRVDLLLTVSESCSSFLRDRYGIANAAVVLNCPDFEEQPRTDRLRRVLNLTEGIPIILYQGTLNAGRGLRQLVESAQHLALPAAMVLIGEGPMLTELRALGTRLHLDGRVFFLPTVPVEELPAYTAAADVGVMLLEPINLSKAFALANKVFQYMAASLPLVLSRSVEHDRLLAEVGCGTAAPTLAPRDIARTIDRVLEEPQQARQMGQLGRTAFEEKYNWPRQEEVLLRAYARLFEGDNRRTSAPGA